jgi:CubicO group peptidase (beta-lactamase class C family)
MARMRIASAAVLALSLLAAQSTPTPAPGATGQAGDAAILQNLKAKAPPLLLLRGEEQRVAYANIEKLAPVNTIRAGGPVYPLPEAPRDFSAFRYEHKGARQTIDDFMQQMNVVGLLVITDGRIVLERYARGHTANARWASMSVAKSVTSLLYGAAVRDGLIKSLDEPVTTYQPELKGSAYDGVTIRHLLQMSSGVAWSERPVDPQSDVSQLSRLNAEGGFRAQLAYMAKRPRAAEPGRVFNYNTSETDLAGAILRGLTGKTLSEYLSEKIWRRFGMQADGYWVTMQGSDLERAGCCISATLRDYGRVGLFALAGGTSAGSGSSVLPERWLEESTRPSHGSKDYGYFWWLRPNGRYYASGSFGQHIEVAADERTVVAMQSYWPVAFNPELIEHNDTFVDALIKAR